MNQHTLGKEFCGEGKKNGGTAGGKLGEQFVFQDEKVNKVVHQWEQASKEAKN